MVLIPKISGCHTSKNQRLMIQIENYIQFTLISAFIFIPIFIVLGLPICNLIFNNPQAGIYLSYSAWIIIPMSISQITSSILNALNQEKKTFIYYIISSIFMIITIIILPKYTQILAMTFSIGISNIILAYLNLRRINITIHYQSNIIFKLLLILSTIS